MRTPALLISTSPASAFQRSVLYALYLYFELKVRYDSREGKLALAFLYKSIKPQPTLLLEQLTGLVLLDKLIQVTWLFLRVKLSLVIERSYITLDS